ncbi:hypothetical protein [Bradyrhizobium sp. Ce-3]|uniref:hypothetical protein n=1 Tax=Bradyrhizobium sp. Ce-3 TaxID=2913970 RepID=UPI001FC87BE4|nr:hypothetical protein [Bradyrhizobium sp. Ce-3]
MPKPQAVDRLEIPDSESAANAAIFAALREADWRSAWEGFFSTRLADRNSLLQDPSMRIFDCKVAMATDIRARAPTSHAILREHCNAKEVLCGEHLLPGFTLLVE